MKNVMFSLAFMLIGSFAFAKNDVVSNSINKIEYNKIVGLCIYTITTTYYHSDGSTTTTTTTYYNFNSTSQADCEYIAQSHVNRLNRVLKLE